MSGLKNIFVGGRRLRRSNTGIYIPPPPPVPPPPPPPPSLVGLYNMGVNSMQSLYYTGVNPNVDIARPGTGFVVVGGTYAGQSVPAAYRDLFGYPNAMPPGATAIDFYLQSPNSMAPYSGGWLNVGAGPPTMSIPNNVSAQSVTLGSQSFSLTPSIAQPTSGAIVIRYTITPGNYPKDFTCRPTIDPGGIIDPVYQARMAAINSPSGPFRLVKRTNVELDISILPDPYGSGVGSLATVKFVVDGDGQMTRPVNFTDTFRNRTLNDGGYLDGTSFELMIQECAQLNQPAWWSPPWNYHTNKMYIRKGAQLFAADCVIRGKFFYIQGPNEDWNYGYVHTHQRDNEAAFLGITPLQRVSQKWREIFDIFVEEFTNAGVISKLRLLGAWQNSGNPADIDTILGYTSINTMPQLYGLSTALYHEADNLGIGYNGSLDTYAEETTSGPLSLSIANVVETWGLAWKNKANSLGLHYLPYEGGDGPTLSNSTFKISWATSQQRHDREAFWYERIGQLFGYDTIFTPFAYSYPVGAVDNWIWGILSHTSGPVNVVTDAPRYFAQNEALHGIKTLQTLIPSAATFSNLVPSGTVVCTYSRKTTEGIVTLTSNPGNLFALGVSTPSTVQIITNAAGISAGAHNYQLTETNPTAVNGPTKITNGTLTATAAAAAHFASANGIDKNSNIALSNGDLDATHAVTFVNEFVRMSAAFSGDNFVFKLTVLALDAGSGNFFIGIDDGTVNFNTSPGTRPGQDTSTGILFTFSHTGWVMRKNSGGVQNQNTTYSGHWPVATVIELRGTISTHTVSLYRNNVLEVNDAAGAATFVLPTLGAYKGFVGMLLDDKLQVDPTGY